MKAFTKNELIKSFLYLHFEIKNKKEAQDVINTLEEFRNDWENLRNPWFERTFPLVYITYGHACMVLEDYEKAISILNEGAQKLEHSDFKYFFWEKVRLYDLLSKSYIHKGNKDKAYTASLNSVYNELYAINKTHHNDFEFYGFRDFNEYSLADIANETISLCSVDLFNDPVDTAFFPWMHFKQEMAENQNEKDYLKIQEAAYKNIRARCLVRNIPLPYKEGIDYPIYLPFQREYANTVMWAHYANYHKGFCVKYCIPSSFTMTKPEDGKILMLMPMSYTERFPLMDCGEINDSLTFKKAFFTKHKTWEYEHEHRLLYFDKQGSSDFPTPQLPKGCIKAIYIGVKCSEENKSKIFKAIKNKPDIEVFQMQISSQDIYKLKAVKIKKNRSKKCRLLTYLAKIIKKLF
ncbi:DUF2971 domain-containing protein [Prevotella nigrescens]|uniref:DUF2971 domain-containing protein n=1 Tax=Prevotella nigrescens TaxID=28133 RepID=UPI0028EB2883|nr:DUF2971 domain-containing protein [Prevotella nigrescens]